MKRFISVLGAGAALMYFLDPKSGRGRRARVRDRAEHVKSSSVHTVGKAGRDLRNRARGASHAVTATLRREVVPDGILRERVRSALGHHVRHAKPVDVDVVDGTAILSGAVVASEADGMVKAVEHVGGIREVIDRMERYEHPEDIPGFEGSARGGANGHNGSRRVWSPAARLAVGVGSGALTTFAVVRHRPISIPLGVLGAAGLARVASRGPRRS
jgi:hypothetical protein